MGIAQRYRKPADLPPRLAVFPLRGAILLPRATLPINVFEPRYLTLIDDVMSGSRVLGVLQPMVASESDVTESPSGKSFPVHRVGCAGRITSYKELDDGRYVVTLTGLMRFAIVGECETDKPYRVMSASYDAYATDLTEGLGEERVDRENLLRVLKSYLEANNLKTDWSAIQRASNEFLINALSVMAPYGPEEKQALLEAADLKTRAEVLVALAEIELASNGGSGSTLQ